MDQDQYSLFLFTVETLGCLISLSLRFSSPSSFLAPSPTTFSVLWVSAHHGFSIVLWGFFLGVVVPQKNKKIKKSIASEEEQQTISENFSTRMVVIHSNQFLHSRKLR
jgi:hypothetical protein